MTSVAPYFITVLTAAILFFQHERLADPEFQPADIHPINQLKEYDFIIIGAGTAGMCISYYTQLNISIYFLRIYKYTKYNNLQEQLLQIDLAKKTIGKY